MKTLKYSKQRTAIKSFLMSRDDHPTADTVYMNIKGTNPSISLATVYRNLNLLVEIGEAVKITSNDGRDRYDAKISPHYHLICNDCGAIIDIDIEPFAKMDEIASESTGATIVSHDVTFHGICKACKDKLA